jgi:hypothetical protein
MVPAVEQVFAAVVSAVEALMLIYTFTTAGLFSSSIRSTSKLANPLLRCDGRVHRF